MPLDTPSFSGSPFKFSGHLETMLPAVLRNIHVPWIRERVNTPDGDFIDLDFLGQGNKYLLLLLHGLEGSSNSTYIKGFAKFFNNRGFDICAMNFRSCSGEMNLKPYSYHSGKTDDVHFILQHLNKKNNYTAIALTGFSLGGNVTLRYLAEYKTILPANLLAAAAVSAPVDLANSAYTMAKTTNKIYMVRFLKSLNEKMKLKAKQFPGQINTSNLGSIKTFHEFDSRFTAPLHGFKDAHDYYKNCSSVYVLNEIETPTLLLNAQNDPFLGDKCYPINLITQLQSLYGDFPLYGGHVGFAAQFPNGNYYSEKRVFDFIIKQFLK